MFPTKADILYFLLLIAGQTVLPPPAPGALLRHAERLALRFMGAAHAFFFAINSAMEKCYAPGIGRLQFGHFFMFLHSKLPFAIYEQLTVETEPVFPIIAPLSVSHTPNRHIRPPAVMPLAVTFCGRVKTNRWAVVFHNFSVLAAFSPAQYPWQ
jgi:hypothetical protein